MSTSDENRGLHWPDVERRLARQIIEEHQEACLLGTRIQEIDIIMRETLNAINNDLNNGRETMASLAEGLAATTKLAKDTDKKIDGWARYLQGIAVVGLLTVSMLGWFLSYQSSRVEKLYDIAITNTQLLKTEQARRESQWETSKAEFARQTRVDIRTLEVLIEKALANKRSNP